VSLVPVDAVRGIYEKLSRDAKLAKDAADLVRKYHHKLDEDAKLTPRRSSSTSVESKMTGDQGSKDKETNPQPEETGNRVTSTTTLTSGDTGVACPTSTNILPQELPPPSFTKHLLEQFRMLEEASSLHPRQSDHLRGRRALGRAVSAPSTPVRRRLASAIKQDVDAQSRSHDNHEYRQASSDSPFDRDDSSTTYSDVCADELVLSVNSEVLMTNATAEDDGGSEMPHQGLTKALLAQWRHIEDRMRGVGSRAGRGRSVDGATRVGVVTTSRSQSIPRTLDAGQSRRSSSPNRSDLFVFTVSCQRDEQPDEELSTASVSRFSSVSESADILPPPLMTQYILAKFRDMEAESQIVSGLQAQTTKVC